MTPLFFNHQLSGRLQPLQERALREAYLMLYAYAGAKKENHFIFTSSGTEAVNHAIFAAYLDITRKTGKNHFLCSALDEAPTIMSMSRLHELGSIFQMVPAGKEGKISVKAVAEMITPRTAMLSMSWVNGLTGVIQPLSEISDLCKDRGILFHVEATHALGRGDFSFEESGADILTFNGPVGGMGGMFICNGIEISPLILGGSEQAKMRGGSFNASALIECAKWAKEERSYSDHYTIEIARLRSLFEASLCEKISGTKVLFHEQERVPHISTLIFPGVASEALLFLLSQKGVFATAGGNHFQQLVHLLKACAIPENESHCSLSFAFSHHTTEEEIEKGVETIEESVGQLRKYSEQMLKEALL